MPEPLPVATELTEVLPGIFRWAAYSPHHKVELTSHAILADDCLLVFDPIPLATDQRQRLTSVAGQRALVLTNGNHERDAVRWHHELGAAIWSSPTAFPSPLVIGHCSLGISSPFPRWTALPLPGGAPGETAFLHAGRSLAIFGDAIVNLPDRQLELLPDKYCEDPARLRFSLKGLPRFERALFAHGQPLLSAASERIAALL